MQRDDSTGFIKRHVSGLHIEVSAIGISYLSRSCHIGAQSMPSCAVRGAHLFVKQSGDTQRRANGAQSHCVPASGSEAGMSTRFTAASRALAPLTTRQPIKPMPLISTTNVRIIRQSPLLSLPQLGLSTKPTHELRFASGRKSFSKTLVSVRGPELSVVALLADLDA